MIIDSHQHFWKYDPVKYEWITEDMKILRRDFLPDELKIIYETVGIHGSVAVQAEQSEEESFFLLELADKNDFVKAVVGWTDLRSEKISEKLSYFSTYAKLAGFRHIIQDEDDHNFLLREDFKRGIKALEQHNFTYDILVFPHQLSAVLEFVRLFPNQRFVIDHMAKPYIKDGFFDGWANQIQAIASQENVWCKVSGIITEASWKDWSYEQLVPYLEKVFNLFGSERIMFGSDWPVCLVAGTYLQVLDIVKKYTRGFSQDEKDRIFGLNAKEFYGVG